MNEDHLSLLVKKFENLKIVEMWKTDDARPDREDKWLNAIIKKIEIKT